MTPREARTSPRAAQPPMLHGSGIGERRRWSRQPEWIARVDIGPEKLVARYVGSSERMAFNESVLRESLSSLQAQRLSSSRPPASWSRGSE